MSYFEEAKPETYIWNKYRETKGFSGCVQLQEKMKPSIEKIKHMNDERKLTKYEEWELKAIKREEELIRKSDLTPLECLEILEIKLTGRNWNTGKPFNKWEKEIKIIRRALKEGEKK